MHTIDYLTAMLLGNVLVEELAADILRRDNFYAVEYQALIERGWIQPGKDGTLGLTEAGLRVVDEFLAAHKVAATAPPPSPVEYALVMLVGLGLFFVSVVLFV